MIYYVIMRYLPFILCIFAISALGVHGQLGGLRAGARHNYNNIHLISDLNGVNKIVLQKELSTNSLTNILLFNVIDGSDGTYTQAVPAGMNGCVDPVSGATVNTGGTINIPRAGTSTWLNWGNTGGTQQTANRAQADWAEDKWISIAYCDSTTTLYQIEIKLVNQLANGNDGSETTKYFWHLEASFQDSNSNVLATEEVHSDCPAEFYKDSVQGTYGQCSKCDCPSGYTNLCDGTSTTTFSQSNDCQQCMCQAGYAAVDAACAVSDGNWPAICATNAQHADCGPTKCLPCTCDGPGYVFDHIDCPGTKTYNTWLNEKHEDVAGAVGPDGSTTETGGHCQICKCSTRGYYIDPDLCSGAGNKADSLYNSVAYTNDGDYQDWVDAHCRPCSCGDKDRLSTNSATFDGYYVSTEVGQCDGYWQSHVHGKLVTTTGGLTSSVTQEATGAADGTYTGLTPVDNNGYASGAILSVTIASGVASAVTATTAGANYVERDTLTVSKTAFSSSSCEVPVASADQTLAFGNDGASHFTYSGNNRDDTSVTNDPDITICDNVAYTFQRSSSSHPLRIVTQADCTTGGTDQCADGTRTSTVPTSSLTGWTDVTSSSSTTFTFTSTGTYYYVCTVSSHTTMVGKITVDDCQVEGGRETSEAKCEASAGTWSDGACDNVDYTTEEACTTVGVYTTINLPSQDLEITLLSDDIQAGTATAPHSDISPTAADAAGTGNNAYNTPVAGQLWITTQESTTVATFANNDGWCRECACYTGLTNTGILASVRDGATPVAGSYFRTSFCPAGKPQAAGGNGIRLDASSETASQTNGKGWLDYYGDTSQTVGGPAAQACYFADTADPAGATEWDCTQAGLKRHTYDGAGEGYFINSAAGKCDGKTGYADLAAAATACCTECSCSSGQYIDASGGICDGDTVHEVSSGSQPDNACVDCSCAAGQYFDLSICDGTHPSDTTGAQSTVGSCTSGCQLAFRGGSATTTYQGLSVPNDDDGRVCRDCSCESAKYISTATGKCDGSTGFDSKIGDTDANRKAAIEAHRADVCLDCNCEQGGTITTATNALLTSISSAAGDQTTQTASLAATDVLVNEDASIRLSITYNAAGDDIVGATATAVSTTVYKVGDTFTTNNLVSKGGDKEITFTFVAAALTRDDRSTIIEQLSYINTAICNGFKIQNSPDNSGCTACSCTAKSNSGLGWYIDASLCEGTDTYDDSSVTARDTYCKRCEDKCIDGQYVNTDVCDGTNANSQSSADGTTITDGCKDCDCGAGNYIEVRNSPYKYTETGSLTDSSYTTALAENKAVAVSCDKSYLYSAALNSGNGPAGACVSCSDQCTTAIQGTAKYVDSSTGKCDGVTNGAKLFSATSPATINSVNMPSGGCGSCDCSAGQFIDMQYCNKNIVSTTQPAAADRCELCKCDAGQWLDYQNEESNEGNLLLSRGTAAEGGAGPGALGSGDCLGTEIGTTEVSNALNYVVAKSGQNLYDTTTATTKAGVAPATPTTTSTGPSAPYYCITQTVVDDCAAAQKLTASTSDGLLDTTCTKLKTGEQCPTDALVDCDGKCGGTSLSCPNMYGYVTAYKDSADTCEHRCVKWRGNLRESFNEYLVTDVSQSSICDLLRQSSGLDLTSGCCSGAQNTWSTNCEAVP